jgi:hypothetical protein
MHIFVKIFQSTTVMRQIFTTIAMLAMAFSFASCDKEIIVNCDCNCQCGNGSDQTPTRPGGNEDNTPGGGSDNTGGEGSGSGNEGSGSGTDRSEYTTYNTTFTRGQAGYFGAYYDDQPSTTANWYLELADNNYDLENYEGNGYNIALEFFTSSSYTSSFPAGEYTIEKYNETPYAAGSLLYGFIGKDEENNEYTAGTWLYEGNEGIAGATAGKMKVEVSGSRYTISYTLYDDEFQIAFSGSYSGNLTIYDGTQTASYAPATKSGKSHNRHYRVRL